MPALTDRNSWPARVFRPGALRVQIDPGACTGAWSCRMKRRGRADVGPSSTTAPPLPASAFAPARVRAAPRPPHAGSRPEAPMTVARRQIRTVRGTVGVRPTG